MCFLACVAGLCLPLPAFSSNLSECLLSHKVATVVGGIGRCGCTGPASEPYVSDAVELLHPFIAPLLVSWLARTLFIAASFGTQVPAVPA